MTKRANPTIAACTKALAFLDLLTVKAGARHSRADVADMQTLHDIAVKQGAICQATEETAVKGPLTKEQRQKITATLSRAKDGKFGSGGGSGGSAKPVAKPQAGPRAAAPKQPAAAAPGPETAAALANELNANGVGLTPQGLGTLAQPPDPDDASPEAEAGRRRADAMTEAGLLTKYEDGSYEATDAGKELQAAYEAGDKDKVLALLPEQYQGEKALPAVGSVKALPNGRIGGYAVRFGSADEPDLSAARDYFTSDSELWIERYGLLDGTGQIPMLYDHAQHPSETIKAAPVVGRWIKATRDDLGVFLEGELDSAHAYASAIKELVAKGVLRLSSDSAEHLVVREPQRNGTNWLKRFPVLCCSLTTHPAEPRLYPIDALKHLGVDIGSLTGEPIGAADPRAAVREQVAALMTLYQST